MQFRLEHGSSARLAEVSPVCLIQCIKKVQSDILFFPPTLKARIFIL